MSEKRSTTEESILKAATSEFLEKGYKGAWLRDISRKANVTTGALYGYFRNKEELFGAIVGECYQGIQDMYSDALSHFALLPPERQVEEMQDLCIDYMKRLCDYMYLHHDEFKLILCHSENTEYCNLEARMAHMNQEATARFRADANMAGSNLGELPPFVEHILTTGLFSMFFELVIHDIPREDADEYIEYLVRFYVAGYARVMGF